MAKNTNRSNSAEAGANAAKAKADAEAAASTTPPPAAGPILAGESHASIEPDAAAQQLFEEMDRLKHELKAIDDEVAIIGDPVARMRETGARYGEAVEAKRRAVDAADAVVRHCAGEKQRAEIRCGEETARLNVLASNRARVQAQLAAVRLKMG